jgi:putative PIN family toxin of toxin-antitoxin system
MRSYSVVIDTVVFVRSLLNPHSFSGKLIPAHADEYRLILSTPIIRETLEVLQRPEITRKIRFVAGMDTKRVLDLLSQAELVELSNIPQVSRDPKDDKFLQTAVLDKADYVVSEDRDLLDFGEYQGIKIVEVGTFVRILNANKAQ